jgi:hypothetical protein
MAVVVLHASFEEILTSPDGTDGRLGLAMAFVGSEDDRNCVARTCALSRGQGCLAVADNGFCGPFKVLEALGISSGRGIGERE